MKNNLEKITETIITIVGIGVGVLVMGVGLTFVYVIIKSLFNL
jgi:hypothetical protein